MSEYPTLDLMSDSVSFATTPQLGFDDRGVPQTVGAARAMSKEAIRQAVVNVVAYLEETTPAEVAGWAAAPDGSVGVESQLGVDVYNEFVGHLGESGIKLTSVEQEDWASVNGLTEVLTEAFAKMKAAR